MSWLQYTLAAFRLSQRVFWKRIGFALTGSVLPLGLGILISTNSRGTGAIDGTRPEFYILTGFIAFGLFFIVYNLVNAVTARRDALIYKRLRSTPLPESSIFVAEGTGAVMIGIGVAVLLIAYGITVLGTGVPHNVPLLVLGMLLGAAMFTMLAVGLSGILPGAETSVWIITPLMVVFLMASGVFLPVSQLPAMLQPIAPYLPLTPVVEMVRTGYLGMDFTGGGVPSSVGFLSGFQASLIPILITLAWTALGLAMALKLFRWDPKRGR